MKKAQLLTVDFIISLAIFVSILLTLITVWSTFDTQIRDLEKRRDLQSISIVVTDSLIRSSGNPENWNSTNVQSIGLAKAERILDLSKINSLMEMNYLDVKSTLRLGGLTYSTPEHPYEFYLYFTDKDGNNLTNGIVRSPIAYYSRDPANTKVLDKLNGKGLIWDFYWGNAEASLPAPKDTYDFRNYYEQAGAGNQVKFVNQTLIGSSGVYRTIIIENLELDALPGGRANKDLNITALQDFVNKGGILIVVGQGGQGANIIDENFSMHSVHSIAGWGDGSVVDPWYILPLDSKGKRVLFSQSGWYFESLLGDNELHVFVSVQGQPDQGMICYWPYGFGRVYYIEDLRGSIQGGPQLSEVTRIVGSKLRLGLTPALPSQVVNVKRTAVLEGVDRELVNLVLGVWG